MLAAIISVRNRLQNHIENQGLPVCDDQSIPRKVTLLLDRDSMPPNGKTHAVGRHIGQGANELFVDPHPRVFGGAFGPDQAERNGGSTHPGRAAQEPNSRE